MKGKRGYYYHYSIEWNSRLRDEWSKLHAFSVGTSTGGEVRKLGLHPVGEDSGNAENLCKIILEGKLTRHVLLSLVSNERLWQETNLRLPHSIQVFEDWKIFI